jgi:hypothetical protein
MLDFRKVILALSVAGLGLVGTASAQVPTLSGFAVSGFEGSVAIEGTTEQIPGAVITCSSSTSGGCTATQVGSGLSFSLTANAPITNLTVPKSSPAVLDATVTDNCGDTNGTVTLSGTATVTVSFPSTTAGGTNCPLGLTTITVSGLRVNPSGLPSLSQVTLTLGPTTVVVSATPTTVNFAYVQKSLTSVAITGSTNLSACPSSITPATVLYPVASVIFANGFPDSLKSPTNVQGKSTIPATSPQGTTLAVTFTNLDPGVNYYVPATVGSGVTLQAVTSAEVLIPAIASGPANGLVALTVTSGSATAYYEVTADPGTSESATIALSEIIPSVGGITSFSTSPVAVSITLVSAASGYPQYSTSQAPYTATQTAVANTNGLLSACTTTLLFPYAINVAGFDTGLAITNTSGFSGSAGTCSIGFVGTGAPSTPTITTPAIYNATATNTLPATAPAGSVYAVYPFDVGTAAPGFSGYVSAVCNFQGAHGYAFVSDGLGTGTGIAANYLAIVVADQPGQAVVTPTAQ